MSRNECIDFKVVLSGYLDGELAAPGRTEADRHLLVCPECRELLENAERNDDAIRALCARDPAFAERLGAALPLPADFESTVFNRTQRRSRMHRHRVYGSLGLLATAASLVFAAALFYVLRAGGDSNTKNPNETVVDESEKPHAVIALTDAETQALRTAATTLRGIMNTPFEDVTAREQLRKIVLYDELAERFAKLRTKLDPIARRHVDATRATLFQLVRDRPEVEMWNHLQADLHLIDLSASLESIADASDSRDSA